MTNTDSSHATTALASRIPLSFNQEFLLGFDRGDSQGPFGPMNHIVHGWRLRGEVDLDVLRQALTDVVARHETLRTSIVRDAQPPHQEIFPASTPELAVLDLSEVPLKQRDQRVEKLLNEIESGGLGVQRLPLVRAVLGRFDDTDSVLVLVAHHTATDGWSIRLIIRDLAHLYAQRRGHAGHDLPETTPYREYAIWQRSVAPEYHEAAREYWRTTLRGASIFSVRADRPKSAGLPESTSVYRFHIEQELIAPVVQLARATRSTPFMVLLAAFNLLVQRMTGQSDVVVPTFSPGRSQDRFIDTVGPFFNLLPLRTDLAGCASFRDVVTRTRKTCLDGYSHDMPFGQIAGEAPELMVPVMQDDRGACVFQVFPFPFVLDGDLVGDVVFTELRRRLVSQPVGSDVPNGALWTLNIDPAGDLIGSVQFNSNLYDEKTVSDMVAQFHQVLRETVLSPDARLASS